MSINPRLALDAHRDSILRIVSDGRAANPRVMRSTPHLEVWEGSALGILVDTTAETSLLDLAGIEVALEELLGVSVAVFVPGEIPKNYREAVIAEARTV